MTQESHPPPAPASGERNLPSHPQGQTANRAFSQHQAPTLADLRTYHTLWQFIVLHGLIRTSEICKSCQQLILDKSFELFRQRGCPLPAAVSPQMLDNNLRFCSDPKVNLDTLKVRIIREQARIWKLARPLQFQRTLHDQWMAGLHDELGMKVWLACHGTYTLSDLAVARPFIDSDGSYSYIRNFKRYLASVARPGFGVRCTCPMSNWCPDTRVQTAPDNWLVELEMNVHTADSHYVAPELKQLLETETPQKDRVFDFMSQAWKSPAMVTGRNPLVSMGHRARAHDLKEIFGNLDHLRRVYKALTSSDDQTDSEPETDAGRMILEGMRVGQGIVNEVSRSLASVLLNHPAPRSS